MGQLYQQNEGFYALYHAGHHQVPHQQTMAGPYQQPFFGGYQTMSIPDDEFNFNLQQMLDPSWSAPNAPAALYNYPPPDVPYSS
jgi:hypothetical protein